MVLSPMISERFTGYCRTDHGIEKEFNIPFPMSRLKPSLLGQAVGLPGRHAIYSPRIVLDAIGSVWIMNAVGLPFYNVREAGIN